MRLLLFRHGPAEDRAAWRAKGRVEARRPLTAEGRVRTRAAAKGLARLVEEPAAIATSPLTRAAQSASLLARALGGPRPETLTQLAPGGRPEEVLRWLACHPAGSLAVVVGHEPDLGCLASWLVSGTRGSFLPMKKAGACLLDLGTRPRAGKARISWVIAPAQLRRLGR
ncbi:MAG: histidine phosphatase family protein [Deltaproteobacteria bacterium]